MILTNMIVKESPENIVIPEEKADTTTEAVEIWSGAEEIGSMDIREETEIIVNMAVKVETADIMTTAEGNPGMRGTTSMMMIMTTPG